MKLETEIPEIVKTTTAKQGRNKRSYYGMNVSANIGLEPIDQLDGFLVAKYIQQQYGRDQFFYPYIAGMYNALNARSVKEALKTAAKRKFVEQEKKQLLERIMQNLSLEGVVFTTYDLWNDRDYWTLVNGLFTTGLFCYAGDESSERLLPLAEFPREILGKMDTVAKDIPREIPARLLYTPLEVAEALWLRDRYDVAWKICPSTEESYDRFIEPAGIGIIRTRQPCTQENGVVEPCLPYIGKSTQPDRILFSDTLDTLARKSVENPSFVCARRLADVYERLIFGEQFPFPNWILEPVWRKMNPYIDINAVYQLIKLGK